MDDDSGSANHQPASNGSNATASTVSGPSLARFTGDDILNGIKVSSWLNLFEVVAVNRGSSTDQQKIALLMNYLDKDALQWYADEVAPELTTLEWLTVKQKMVQRFGESQISPIIAASRKTLDSRKESVLSYYTEKMRLMRKTGITESEMVDLLTDGSPKFWQPALIASQPANPSAWLSVATKMETSFKRTTVHGSGFTNPIPTAQTAQVFVSNSGNSKTGTKKGPKRPHKPCQFCLKEGRQEFHWHSECALRLANHTAPKASGTTSGSVPTGHEALILSQEQGN